MNISRKLKAIAASAIAALLVVGGIGLFVSAEIEAALRNSNRTVIPAIQVVYQLKSSQQIVALSIYRHISSTSESQMADYEKAIEGAVSEMKGALDGYEKFVRSEEGRGLLNAEKEAVAKYVAAIPAVLELSRSNDKAGALEKTTEMAASRANLARLIDDHIALNNRFAQEQETLAETHARQGRIVSIVVVLLASVLVGGVAYLVIRGVNRSLLAMQKAIRRIEGDLDFTAHAEVIGKDEISEVASALNRLIDKLRVSLLDIASGATKISVASTQLATASTEVAAASARQSDSAATMAASVEQMTVSITHVSDRSSEAHGLSTQSGQYATEGEAVISETVSDINQIAASVAEASERIHQLETSSEQISTIVAVIKDVAEQTNLLALNAAIEAARAGEQGRGFAVVADEVRKLAERTASSTMQIAVTVESIRGVSRDIAVSMAKSVELVSAGVSQAGSASTAIQRIMQSSHHAVAMVDEISAALREQTLASNIIASNVENIAQMAEESSAAAQNSADSAAHLDKVSGELKTIVSAYRL
ncbi:MAG: methyl-accepting chemotaxis protein [Candidatus Dactylopiibacterium sp.]|nr:methyl-accepting chemotaxis protein [Candidatus Dactylopiibacterium sp.]